MNDLLSHLILSDEVKIKCKTNKKFTVEINSAKPKMKLNFVRSELDCAVKVKVKLRFLAPSAGITEIAKG